MSCSVSLVIASSGYWLILVTGGKFDDAVVHYLDLKLIDNETDIYSKDTQTGQYMQFSSCTP